MVAAAETVEKLLENSESKRLMESDEESQV